MGEDMAAFAINTTIPNASEKMKKRHESSKNCFPCRNNSAANPMQGGTHAGFLRRLYHGFPDLSRGAVGLPLAAALNVDYVGVTIGWVPV